MSPVNFNLKENIGKEYGTNSDCWFYQHTNTNLDSLVFHLLSGYKMNYDSNENNYKLSLVGRIQVSPCIYLYFDDIFNQDLIGNQITLSIWNFKHYVYLQLEPSLLLGSMLNVFFKIITEGLMLLWIIFSYQLFEKEWVQ